MDCSRSSTREKANVKLRGSKSQNRISFAQKCPKIKIKIIPSGFSRPADKPLLGSTFFRIVDINFLFSFNINTISHKNIKFFFYLIIILTLSYYSSHIMSSSQFLPLYIGILQIVALPTFYLMT